MRTGDALIDVALARQQHRAYADALESEGVLIHWIETDETCPDAVFVEDAAVLLGPEALVTVPGAPSRRPEVPPIAAALAARLRTTSMAHPATLDGGDVMRAGDVLFVGLSSRTNRLGLAALEQVAGGHGLTTVGVPLSAGLHLKSVITLAAEGVLVAVEGALDLTPFRAHGLQIHTVSEFHGGNVLALGDTVLVSAHAPQTAALLRGLNLRVVVLNLSELHAGDGALTCLSLRQPPPGRWCA